MDVVSTFAQFLADSAQKGRWINVMFEERLFALVGTLENIANTLRSAQIPFELIGGAAITVHVNRVEPSADLRANRANPAAVSAGAVPTNSPHGVIGLGASVG